MLRYGALEIDKILLFTKQPNLPSQLMLNYKQKASLILYSAFICIKTVTYLGNNDIN